MALVTKNDVTQIFAIQAPAIDLPPTFANYPRGWDTARANNGKPTIKQFNYIQQRTDQNVLWIHQNGATLPYDATMEYAEGAVVVKDGELQKWKGGVWKSAAATTAAELTDASGKSQQEINDSAFRVNAKLLGMLPFTDITAQLEHYLNDSVTHEIYLPKGEYNITREIVCNAAIPKRIYGEVGATIKTNFTTSQRIFDLKSQVDFESIQFDFSNNHCLNAIRYGEGFGLAANLKDITLKNLYDRDHTSFSYLILLSSDTVPNVDGVHTENIRKYCLDTSEENGLYASVIILSNASVTSPAGEIKNITSKNIANVNSEGMRITGGGAKTVHVFSSGGVCPVKLSNIHGTDYGRRVVKVQASGVTVDNVSGDTQFTDSLTVVASQSDGGFICSGNSIKNIIAKGKSLYGVVVTSSDTDVDTVTTDLDHGVSSTGGVYIAKGDEMRLRNLNLSANIPLFVDTTQFDLGSVSIDGITVSAKTSTIYGVISGNAGTKKIKVFNISNVIMHTDQISQGRPLFSLNNSGRIGVFKASNITINDSNSNTNRAYLGEVTNADLVDINGVSYNGLAGIVSDPLIASDFATFRYVSSLNLDDLTYSNNVNRGLRFVSCDNVSIGERINFTKNAGTGHLLFTTCKKVTLAPSLAKYKIIQDADSDIIKSAGSSVFRPKNGYQGMSYYDSTNNKFNVCKTGATYDNNGVLLTDAAYVDLVEQRSVSVTYDPPSIPAGESVSSLQTLSGVTVGTPVIAAFSVYNVGIEVTAVVSANNTVRINFKNVSSSPVDLGSGTITVKAL